MKSTIFINNILDSHQFSTCDNIQDNKLLTTHIVDFESFLRRSCDIDNLNSSNTTNIEYIKQSNVIVNINGLFTIVTDNEIICRSPWTAPVSYTNYQANEEIASEVKLIRSNLADMARSHFFQYKPVFNIMKNLCSDHYKLRPIENYEINFFNKLPVIVFQKIHSQYAQFTCDNISDTQFLNASTHNIKDVYALINAANCAQSSYTKMPGGDIPTHVIVYNNEYNQCNKMAIILNNKYTIYMSDTLDIKVTIRHTDNKFLDYLKPLYQSLHLKPKLDEACLINNSTYKLEQHIKNPEYLNIAHIATDITKSNILDYNFDTDKLPETYSPQTDTTNTSEIDTTTSDHTDTSSKYYINPNEELPITIDYPDNITNYHNDTNEIPLIATASYSPNYWYGLTPLLTAAVCSVTSYVVSKIYYMKNPLSALTVQPEAVKLIGMPTDSVE